MITMGILLTNDDGINAPGLWALASELQDIGTVIVVAPDREQSGIGTAVSLHHPIRVHPVHPPIVGIETYATEGTPTDSVILAVKWLAKNNIDLIISGINQGANLGNDVFISGTVGAALQGYFYSIPSIAISIAAFENLHFAAATKLTKLLARKVQDNTLPKGLLLNINLPNVPLAEIQGLEVTRLGEYAYNDIVEQGHDGKREFYWIKRTKPQWQTNQRTDIWAVEHKQISITPLFNNPSGSVYSRLVALAPLLFQELAALDKVK